jgi:hypothetical protein
MSTLEAYSLGPIPISWLSDIFFILSVLVIMNGRFFVPIMPLALLLFYLSIGFLSTLWFSVLNDTPAMPPRATSSYSIFIALRVMGVISFISALTSAYSLIRSGHIQKLIDAHKKIIIFLMIVTIYIYVAQISGLWEPPRNRMGTQGQDYIEGGVHFTYLFHRAMGTFREPSHLAEFLAATSLLVFSGLSSSSTLRFKYLFFIGVSLCLILTGSLLGIIAFFSGLMVFLFSATKRFVLFPIYIIVLAFPLLFTANAIFNVDLISAIAPRIDAMINQGVSGTNRFDIYQAAQSLPLRLFGYGFGNASLILAQITHSDLVVAVLNLFLAILLDTGPVGLVAVLIVFLAPFFHYVGRNRRDPLFVGALASHIAWIMAAIGRSPELNPVHGIVIGVLYGLMLMNSRRANNA